MDKPIEGLHEIYISLKETSGSTPSDLIVMHNGSGYSQYSSNNVSNLTSERIAAADANSVLSLIKSVRDGVYFTMKDPSYNLPPLTLKVAVNSISAGKQHTLAVKSDGSLWAWGSNTHGQLGSGNYGAGTEKATPIKIMDNVAFVSAGSEYSMAIKTDGSLWAWGENSEGQLGTGKYGGDTAYPNFYFDIGVDEAKPVKIMDNVVYVSASDDHTAAVTSDGTLWTWGSNSGGGLGNGEIGQYISGYKINLCAH
jgi:alpha-tubulin suppressor-like RCC1 family protein